MKNSYRAWGGDIRDRLTANAEPIFYQEIGAGSPLLLIHGSFSNGPTTWAGQMEELRHRHRLIVVDRRGHGQSPAEPRPYTIASDALDVLEAADLSRRGRDSRCRPLLRRDGGAGDGPNRASPNQVAPPYRTALSVADAGRTRTCRR